MDFKGFFESLYSRFILRDVFAKATPGAIVFLGFALWWAPPIYVIEWFTRDHSWGFWLFFFSSAWLLGLAIQSFAEVFHFLEYFPPGFRSCGNKTIDQYNSEFFVAVRDFMKGPENEDHAKRNERFEVIKESCGNTAASVVLVAAVVGARLGFETGVNFRGDFSYSALRLVPFFAAVLWVSYLLYRMHLENCVRQYTYAWRLLNLAGKINENGTLKLSLGDSNPTDVHGWLNNSNLRSGGLNKHFLCLPMACITIWVVFGLIGMLSGWFLHDYQKELPILMWITDPIK